MWCLLAPSGPRSIPKGLLFCNFFLSLVLRVAIGGEKKEEGQNRVSKIKQAMSSSIPLVCGALAVPTYLPSTTIFDVLLLLFVVALEAFLCGGCYLRTTQFTYT